MSRIRGGGPNWDEEPEVTLPMRWFTLLVRVPALLLLATGLQGLAAQAATDRADSLAIALVAELAATRWGSTCEDWAGPRAGASCAEQPSTGWRNGLEYEWCFRGSAPGAMGERYFHALPCGFAPSGTTATDGPRGCTLEEYHARVPVPVELVPELHAAVAGRLEARYGTPQEPGRFHADGAARWEGLRLWTTDGLDVLLYSRTGTVGGGPDLGLLARRRTFVEALTADDAVAWGALRDPHTGVAVDLLRPRFPDLAEALSGATYMRPTPGGDDAAMAALDALLDEADAAEGEAAAALLFAADHVARLATASIDPDPQIERAAAPWALTEPAVERLRGHGLTIRWNTLGTVWTYERDLLRQLAEQRAESPWGERATLVLLRLGWHASNVCAAGRDEFRQVIEHGEEFLRSRPAGPFTDEAVGLVAEAYETWWSLSLAHDDGYVEDPAEYAEGAEDARLRAIELYRHLLDTDAPASGLAARQLPRLELGIDTHQRRYFCVYD